MNLFLWRPDLRKQNLQDAVVNASLKLVKLELVEDVLVFTSFRVLRYSGMCKRLVERVFLDDLETSERQLRLGGLGSFFLMLSEV